MRIRVIEPEELKPSLLEQIAQFEQESYRVGGFDQWILPVFARYGRLLILEGEGEILGVAEILRSWQDAKKAYLTGFSIAPAERGKGLGKTFLTEIIKILKKDGLHSLQLTVSPRNKAALFLYKDRFGFKEVSFSKDEYGAGEDRFILELEI